MTKIKLRLIEKCKEEEGRKKKEIKSILYTVYTVQYIEKSWKDMREIGEEYYSMYEYTQCIPSYSRLLVAWILNDTSKYIVHHTVESEGI